MPICCFLRVYRLQYHHHCSDNPVQYHRSQEVAVKCMHYWLNIFFLLAFLPLCITGCSTISPIRIGFTAELTGKQNELAISLRNGVLLAVEELNANGGIDGRKIELVIEDDQGTPEGAREAENNLIDAGVAAIVGHLTSSQTAAGYPVAQERGTVLISATASSATLTGIKDMFFCTTPSTTYLGSEFAKYISGIRSLSSVAILLDEDNNAYSSSLADSFTTSLENAGGKISARVAFPGNSINDFIPYVYGLRLSNPKAVLIIASPINAGLISQQIRLQNWDIPLFAAPWARGQELLRNGGDAIEGLELIIAYDADSPDPVLTAFTDRYVARFAQEPAFTATYGYEVIQVLAEALKITNGRADGLPEALSGLSDISTLTSTITIDEYGDTIRPLFIQRVEDGHFVTVGRIDIQ
jgi:branched-chain amino acid transport system substrate-binding protein